MKQTYNIGDKGYVLELGGEISEVRIEELNQDNNPKMMQKTGIVRFGLLDRPLFKGYCEPSNPFYSEKEAVEKFGLKSVEPLNLLEWEKGISAAIEGKRESLYILIKQKL